MADDRGIRKSLQTYGSTSSVEELVPATSERKSGCPKVKIAVMLGTIISIAGLTVFLVHPREVSLKLQDFEVLNCNFSQQDPWIVFQMNLVVENTNYFAVHLNNTNLLVIYRQTIVANESFTEDVKVSLHATKKVSMSLNISYPYYDEGPSGVLPGPGFYMKRECYEQKTHVEQEITVFSELSTWIDNKQIETGEYVFYIDCSKGKPSVS